MTTTTRKPEFSIIAGVFQGLAHLLIHFTQSAEEGMSIRCTCFPLIWIYSFESDLYSSFMFMLIYRTLARDAQNVAILILIVTRLA